MEKHDIVNRVFEYNKKSVLDKDKLKPVHFKYALMDNVITDEEYDFYFNSIIYNH